MWCLIKILFITELSLLICINLIALKNHQLKHFVHNLIGWKVKNSAICRLYYIKHNKVPTINPQYLGIFSLRRVNLMGENCNKLCFLKATNTCTDTEFTQFTHAKRKLMLLTSVSAANIWMLLYKIATFQQKWKRQICCIFVLFF